MKTFIGLIGEWKKGYEGMHIAGRGQTDGIYVGMLMNSSQCGHCGMYKTVEAALF